jgi:hypothetical protein
MKIGTLNILKMNIVGKTSKYFFDTTNSSNSCFIQWRKWKETKAAQSGNSR